MVVQLPGVLLKQILNLCARICPLTCVTGAVRSPQTVRGGAEGGQTRCGEKQRRGGHAAQRGAETSGRVTKEGGGVERRPLGAAESEESREPADGSAGGAAHPAPSRR